MTATIGRHPDDDVLLEVLGELRMPITIFTLRSASGRPAGRAVAPCRAKVYARLRELGWSYPRIADTCGVSHSTVMAAVRKGQP